MSDIPILTSNRLLLRPFSMDDAPRITDLLQEPEIALNGLGIPQPFHLADAEKMIHRFQQMAEKNHFTWGIVSHKTNDLLGVITLILTLAHHHAEIGFWLGKAYWNQGYATEAGQYVIDYGFVQYELNKIFAKSLTDNEASTRVLEKLGMKPEGLLRQHVWHPLRQQFKDVVMYGILQDELTR